MNTQRERALGLAAIVTLALDYATFGILIRQLNTEMPVFQQLAYRILLAAILATIVLWPRIREIRWAEVPRSDWMLLFLRCLVCYLIGGVAYVAALTYTSIANVAFLCAFPFEIIFAPILLKEKVPAKVFIGFVACVTGAFLIAAPQLGTFGVGEGLALASAAGMALFYVSRRKHSSVLTDLQLTPIILWTGGLMLLVISLVVEPLPTKISNSAIIISIVLGVFNGANVFLANYGFARVPGAVAGNVLLIEAPLSALLAWIVWNEAPTGRSLFGGLLILTGVYFSNRASSSASAS
jgi:drug/metabolite transporter (DMT)-like permease